MASLGVIKGEASNVIWVNDFSDELLDHGEKWSERE